MRTDAISLTNGRRTALVLGMAVAVCLLLGGLAYWLVFVLTLDRERALEAQRLDGFALALEATIRRHESLPSLLALDPSLRAVLKAPADQRRVAEANGYLEAAQQRAAVATAYLIDTNGLTVAASNWRQQRSFVGHNYAFRPYFQDALEKGLGRFYGIGVTTGEPGYFIAAPVREQNRTLGVVVLKIGLDSIEQALAGTGDTLLLADSDGVVFLAADPRLRYRSLAPLAPAVVKRLVATQQYGGQPVQPLADRVVQLTNTMPLRLALSGKPAGERLIHARPVGSFGWQVVYLADTGEIRATALAAANAVGFAVAFALGLAAHFRHRARRREELRGIYAQLEQRIAERTAELTYKITTLERTEAILRETRDAAVQAGKLATLGQMSAGISHELNQPLAALQTFADNARTLLLRGRPAEAAENLETISDLVGRAGRIVRQLKTFARKEAATPQAVAVTSAIEHALTIIEPRRRETGAHIAVGECAPGLCVLAEAGRLEQVLVNLMRNGLDAMNGSPTGIQPPCLDIGAERMGARVAIRIRDHGPGLAAEVLDHLFEPFYTTKPVGEGLGLGLAISLSIVESYGGTLSAHNADEGGAEFVLILPAAQETDAPSNP